MTVKQVWTETSDIGVEITILYDNGERYKQFISWPHREKGFPALRGRWQFQTKA